MAIRLSGKVPTHLDVVRRERIGADEEDQPRAARRERLSDQVRAVAQPLRGRLDALARLGRDGVLPFGVERARDRVQRQPRLPGDVRHRRSHEYRIRPAAGDPPPSRPGITPAASCAAPLVVAAGWFVPAGGVAITPPTLSGWQGLLVSPQRPLVPPSCRLCGRSGTSTDDTSPLAGGSGPGDRRIPRRERGKR